MLKVETKPEQKENNNKEQTQNLYHDSRKLSQSWGAYENS